MVYGQFPKSMVRFARSICQDGNKRACRSFWFLNSAANWEDKMWRGEPKSLSFSGRIDVKSFRIIKSTNRNRSEISGSWERKPGARLKQATLRSHAVCFLAAKAASLRTRQRLSFLGQIAGLPSS